MVLQTRPNPKAAYETICTIICESQQSDDGFVFVTVEAKSPVQHGWELVSDICGPCGPASPYEIDGKTLLSLRILLIKVDPATIGQ